jgi:hypothetical protein
MFPPKVTIREKDLIVLLADIATLQTACRANASRSDDASDRIKILETSISGIKDLLAKTGATTIKSEAEKMRDQFVRGEFTRAPNRIEVERAAK